MIINFVFLSFAFFAGVAAFFNPCGIALLPGYITYYLSQGKNDGLVKNILQGLWFGTTASLGFFIIFGISGSLVLLVGNVVRPYLPWVNIIFGILLVGVGFLMLFGKDVFLTLPQFHSKSTSGVAFGIVYGIGALGCTLPLFVSVLLGGIVDASLLSGFASLLAYVIGMSLLMIGVTVATIIVGGWVRQWIHRVIPYVKKLSAVIIIFAGAYMVYYQTLLL